MDKPKIIVKNTCVQLQGYKFGSCPPIENNFLCYEPTTHSYYFLGLYYDEEKEILYLPRGLDIWYIENQLQEKAIVERDMFNDFDVYNDIKIRYMPRDDLQRQALRFMLGKEEYKRTLTKSQLSVNLNTGKGKTYVSVATFVYTGIKTMIITYSVNWLKQWKEKILEYTNLKEKEILFIEGSNTIYRIMNMSQSDLYKYKILLVTHATIKSFGDNNGWDKVTELFKHLRVGIKIFDEAHMNFSNMAMIDFYTNVYKTYYLTATAMRSDPRENQIYQTSMKNIMSIELFDPEKDPHSDYWSVLFNSKPSPDIVSACRNQYGLDRNKYMNYAIQSDKFRKATVVLMDLVMQIMRGFPYSKCLIYIGTNNAIDIFIHWIVEIFPELYGMIGVYTSVVSPEEKELAKEKKFIVTTTKSASACLDIKDLKVVLLLDEPFSSEVIARQTLGRLRDNDTIYIEAVDVGFNACRNFYNKKKPVFAKYAKDCQQTKISDNELEERYNRIISRLNARPNLLSFS